MEEDSYGLTMNGDCTTTCRSINTSYKDELSYSKADAEVDVNEVTHVAAQRPKGKSEPCFYVITIGE